MFPAPPPITRRETGCVAAKFAPVAVHPKRSGAERRIGIMMHELKMDVRKSDITKMGVTFTVHDENGKSGTLEVRLGSLTWYSGYKTKNNKCVVSWEEFAKFMMQRRSKQVLLHEKNSM